MPIYEYLCDDCGHPFELLVRGAATAVCPACSSRSVTKQLSLPKVKSRVTHQKAMRAAKQRDRRMNAEQTRARIEYEQSHDD
jgi:putative FmdB family regulatory protein